MKISVIVPVYNSQDSLDKCIRSIIYQTYNDLQIVLVDDGSSDKCPEICDKYQMIDSRILVIHQNNQGVSGARNSGLDKAVGDYISFIDSDDYLQLDYYEKFIEIINNTAKFHDHNVKNNSIDIICSGYIREYPFHICKKYSHPSYNDGLTFDDKMISLHLLPALFWEDVDKIYTLLFICNKLIRRSLLEVNKIRFPLDWNHAEDANVLISCYCHAKNVLFTHFCGYHYVRSLKSSSLSTKFRPDFFSLELRFRQFLNDTIGPIIHQDFQNVQGYLSLIAKANNCIINIILNVKDENIQNIWLLYIFNHQEYRTALMSLENNLLDARTIQYKDAILNNNFIEWYRIAKQDASSKYIQKLKISIQRIINSLKFMLFP